jgi:pimeloyl-ACP methyl ester carboxylesterase
MAGRSPARRSRRADCAAAEHTSVRDRINGATIVDVGTGPPVVLVPGIQGRWEWMAPAVGALARRCRVVTFSLCGERGSGVPIDGGLGFDCHVAQVERALDRVGLARAALCGVSFGGLIALRVAAKRPERVTHLVLVSALSPRWRPDGRVRRYLEWPRLAAPFFVLGAPLRLGPEIAAAFPDWCGRLRFAATHAARVARAPFAPRLMAERIRLEQAIDLEPDCAAVRAPTLVVTGEAGLDRVVPVEGTLDFVRLIPGARHVVLERTGHLGLVTRPDAWATIVSDFVRPAGRAAAAS